MREVPEWVGKYDDSPIPDRVRLRVYLRHGGRCHCCGRLIRVGERWEADHVIALSLGGSNRESNLAPILADHHRQKSKSDVELKSVAYRIRKKHLGLKKS